MEQLTKKKTEDLQVNRKECAQLSFDFCLSCAGWPNKRMQPSERRSGLYDGNIFYSKLTVELLQSETITMRLRDGKVAGLR